MRRRDKDKDKEEIEQSKSKDKEDVNKYRIRDKEENKKNVYRSLHYTVKVTKKENEINQINNGKEERERKEYTINANKNYNNNTNNNFTIQRKNSDSTRESNVNTIPMGRVRHLTRKVEKSNRIQIDQVKKDDAEDKKIKINYKPNYEGTFKNSIRNTNIGKKMNKSEIELSKDTELLVLGNNYLSQKIKKKNNKKITIIRQNPQERKLSAISNNEPTKKNKTQHYINKTEKVHYTLAQKFLIQAKKEFLTQKLKKIKAKEKNNNMKKIRS